MAKSKHAGDPTHRKILRLLRIEEMVKERSPIKLLDMVAIIESQEGLSEKLSRKALKNLYLRKKINLDEETEIITWREHNDDKKT